MVIPVYGDLPSLERCVVSVLDTVDTTVDSVLLVNDCGPDADTIERRLTELIAGRDGVRYERNDTNLGFVGACNRAALELDSTTNDILLLNSDTVVTSGWLDELGAVLHDRADHGIVCARSTNATIASLPFRLRDPATPRTMDRSKATLDAVRDELPRYSYPPVAMGFCFLIRRELITEHGLFDEVFAPGYGEENDFCLRMDQHGYRSVMAHHVLVEHEGARSFLSARRAKLRADHERILVERHPDYPARVRDYLWAGIDPVDAFADVLAAPPGPRHVAIVTNQDPTAALAVVHRAVPDASVAVMSPRPPRRRGTRPGVEFLRFGEEEGRVWDAVVLDGRVSRTARLRAHHAAPRVIESDVDDLKQAIHDAVDMGQLCARWAADAADMRESGFPAPPRSTARARIRTLLERRAPALLALRQRLTSRSQQRP